MWSHHARRYFTLSKPVNITLELQDYMRSFDFHIGALEVAIGTNLPYAPVKMVGRQNIIYARDEDFIRVKELGGIVVLANNQVLDLREEELKNRIYNLGNAGIKHIGAIWMMSPKNCYLE